MLERNGYPTSTLLKIQKKSIFSTEQTSKSRRKHHECALSSVYFRCYTKQSEENSQEIRTDSEYSSCYEAWPHNEIDSALEPPQCPVHGLCLACLAGFQGRCTIVYRLKGTLYSGSYIGETKRPV